MAIWSWTNRPDGTGALVRVLGRDGDIAYMAIPATGQTGASPILRLPPDARACVALNSNIGGVTSNGTVCVVRQWDYAYPIAIEVFDDRQSTLYVDDGNNVVGSLSGAATAATTFIASLRPGYYSVEVSTHPTANGAVVTAQIL